MVSAFLHTSKPSLSITLNSTIADNYQTRQRLVSVSLPNVKGALPPTVTAAFVDAASTFWQIEKSSFTQKHSA
jgi:hypothetical protein